MQRLKNYNDSNYHIISIIIFIMILIMIFAFIKIFAFIIINTIAVITFWIILIDFIQFSHGK